MIKAILGVVLLSFIKELLNTSKGQFYIYGKDILGALTLFIVIIVGELMTPLTLGIPITKIMLIRMFGIALSGFLASILATNTLKKMLEKNKQDKPYQFIIKFKTIEIAEFVQLQLKEYKIKTYLNKNNKTLKAFSLNKVESKIIKDTIEDKFKNYSVNEFKEYINK